MTTFIPRSPHAPSATPAAPTPARNAALLIDFDNITLGVRSDLGKELRTLLNSEIFAGKVAVRRAYADWRRYPSYVVPLTEASVDLIFAPAYGTSKKNATDLRMAVDAIELAFMRPEIGTFILLTGDSDFTSCVVKLKEYGKYVIGVGMRESSSDLLIQNCDEYYSYHALSGLTREGEPKGPSQDPWLLARKAAKQMAAGGDSMRTDRLKQVMIDIDPNFNEKDVGYSKFSKFAQAAAEKGLIRLHKVENGQYEVAPLDDDLDESQPSFAAPRRDDDGRRDRDRDRGRGRDRDRGGRGRFGDRDRDRDRFERGPRLEAPSVVHLPEAEPEAEPQAPASPVFAAAAEAAEAPAAQAPAAAVPEVDPVQNAYALLHHAVRSMVSRPGSAVRDGDVKRRMLEMSPGFDEQSLGFSKFSRFLRQAHDAEVIDLRRLGEGRYEVALPASGTKLPPPVLRDAPRPEPIHVEGAELPPMAADTAVPAPERAEREGEGGRDRGRDRGRGRGRRGERAEGPPPFLPGQVVGTGAEASAEPARPAAETREEAPAAEARPEPARAEAPAPEARPERPSEPAPAPSPSRDAAADAQRGLRHRSRGRGWSTPSGPPPLLPGQVINVPGAARAAEPPQPEPAPEAAPAAEAPAAEARPATPAAFSPEALGLPTERDEIARHLRGYKGTGAKQVESLVNAFGDRVFHALEEDADAVRSLLGRRADTLLEQYAADRDARRAEREAAAPVAEEAPSVEADAAPSVDEGSETGDETEAQERGGRRRGRRGGRGRGRGRGEGPGAEEVPGVAEAMAEAPAGDTDPSLVEQVTLPPAAEAVEAAVEPPAGDTDPTLTEQAALPAGEAAPRGRSRSRGGRGRGRGRADAAPEVEAGVATPPAGDTDPTLASQAERPSAAEAAPAAEEGGEARGGRSRGRRGRGRGRGNGDDAARAEAPAPAPAPEPAAEAPAETGGRRGRGGRGRGGEGRAGDGARPGGQAPAAEAAPAAPPAETGGTSGGRSRSGRGRGGNARPAAEAPAPAPEPTPPANGGGGRSRRGGRGRGGRGRGNNAAE